MVPLKVLAIAATGGTELPVVAELLARGFSVPSAAHRRDGRSEPPAGRGVEVTAPVTTADVDAGTPRVAWQSGPSIEARGGSSRVAA